MPSARVLVVALVALCAAVVCIDAADVSPVPLVMWSSKNHFSAPHTNVGQAVAAHDVECALRMLSKKQHGCAGESLFQHVHPSAEAPAAILAFVYSKLGSEEFSLVSGAYGHSQMESTKKLIDAADSVLVAPYVYRPVGSASIADVLARLAHASNAHAVTFRAHDSVASIEQSMRAQPKIGAGRATDVIVVHIDSAAHASKTDALIARVSEIVASRTRGNFVALITADASSHSVQTAFPLPSASHSHSPAGRSLLGFVELQSFSSAGAALANSTYTGPQYITSNIWLGLMVGFFLLFTLGVGVTVISSIEAPVRFPRRVFVVKKEY